MAPPDVDWLDPTFNPTSTDLVAATALYIVLGEPFLGRSLYRRRREQ